MKVHISRSSEIVRTPRLLQVEGMFDIPPSKRSEERWSVDLDLPEQWNIGLIVGPSGSGKTTVARELFGASLVSEWDWPKDKSLIDGFPEAMSIKDITALLSSVGFSSPPMWLRPYHVLSNGQQFRVHMARTLAECPALSVVDEFTSVVDRTVAQIGSCAIAKAVRKRGQQFIGVSCHFDIIDWMEPDWVYYVHTSELVRQAGSRAEGTLVATGCASLTQLAGATGTLGGDNLARGRLHQSGTEGCEREGASPDWRQGTPCGDWRRPAIELEIRRCHHSCWSLFRPYHYLDHSFHKAARCFVAFYQDRPVALQAVLYQQHPKAKNLYRGHRAVCLPDFQGVGIGNALIDTVARAYRGLGNRIVSTTASPALNRARASSPNWRCIHKPHLAGAPGKGSAMTAKGWTPAMTRLTTTWEFVGEPMEKAEARALVYG